MDVITDHALPCSEASFLVALAELAERDATALVACLAEFGFLRSELPEGDREQFSIPHFHALSFGLAIRLRRWELQGIRVHIDNDLPSAEEILQMLATRPHDRDLRQFLLQAHHRSLWLYRESFLWSAGDCDLQAEVAIVADEDEMFLDQLVDFLWQHASGKVGN